MSAISTLFKKAIFPAVTAVVFLVLFLTCFYLMIIEGVPWSNFIGGLFFLIPAIIFWRIAVLTVRGKLKTAEAIIATGLLIPILGYFMFAFFVSMMFNIAFSPAP